MDRMRWLAAGLEMGCGTRPPLWKTGGGGGGGTHSHIDDRMKWKGGINRWLFGGFGCGVPFKAAKKKKKKKEEKKKRRSPVRYAAVPHSIAHRLDTFRSEVVSVRDMHVWALLLY